VADNSYHEAFKCTHCRWLKSIKMKTKKKTKAW